MNRTRSEVRSFLFNPGTYWATSNKRIRSIWNDFWPAWEFGLKLVAIRDVPMWFYSGRFRMQILLRMHLFKNHLIGRLCRLGRKRLNFMTSAGRRLKTKSLGFTTPENTPPRKSRVVTLRVTMPKKAMNCKKYQDIEDSQCDINERFHSSLKDTDFL